MTAATRNSTFAGRTRRRRLPPALQRVVVAVKARKWTTRVAAGVLIGVVVILSMLWRSLRPAAFPAELKRPVRFDRERELQAASFPPLLDLKERDRLWPPNLEIPICRPKIHMYTLPEHLRLSDATIKQCRWSAYNSELQLYRLLQEWNPACELAEHIEVTSDPSLADLFFVPLFPSCYSFECWVKAGWKKTERCGVDEQYIQPIMHWVKAQPSWQQNNGADHLVLHPMDFGDGYYTTASRSAMNATIHLVTVGDNRPPPFSAHFRHFQDLVIPSSTHLINSYYVNPMDYVDELGHPFKQPRGFADPRKKTKDEPTYAETWRSSVSSRTWPSGASSFLSFLKMRSITTERLSRSTTAIFRGGVGNPGEDERYALGIRSLFFPSPTGNVSEPPFSSSVHPGFSSLQGWDIATWSENDDYARRLAQSKYGLAPPGYTLDTTRIYEYMAFGVVPVFIGTGPRAGQVMPFERDFDWQSFTVYVPRDKAHELPQILNDISDERYEELRQNVWNVGRLLVLEGRRGNVWKWLARDLCRMRRIGTDAGPEISNN
ncbi:hypothetical protein OIV83_004532 [Microbotryomycetes sp. JL201]|nr:hypothetical protein OIV83_004532 [Microbotryomycetes sp. JL201]